MVWIFRIKIVRKKSTTAEIYIDPTKIITLKKLTPKKPENIYKNFPTYTNIQLTGNLFSLNVIETPEEIQKQIKGI